MRQFGGQQTQAALALGQADVALDLHPITDIGVVLLFVGKFILFRPAQCRPGKPDAVLVAKAQILPVAVDFVGQNPLWILVCALAASLNDLF